MSTNELPRLLNDAEARETLGGISAGDLQWLVDTDQLSEVWLRGNRFFDSEDIASLIHTYKAVQSRGRHGDDRSGVKKPTSDQNDPEYAAINQMLSSGALNPPPVDGSARPHPLIRHTASLLRSRSHKDEHGILLPREASRLDVKVSEGKLERALLLMAQVLVMLERQGASIEISEQGRTAHPEF